MNSRISRDLGEDIRRNNEVWEGMSAPQRSHTKTAWRLAGWNVCAHRGCPPWDCRITNP